MAGISPDRNGNRHPVKAFHFGGSSTPNFFFHKISNSSWLSLVNKLNWSHPRLSNQIYKTVAGQTLLWVIVLRNRLGEQTQLTHPKTVYGEDSHTLKSNQILQGCRSSGNQVDHLGRIRFQNHLGEIHFPSYLKPLVLSP